MSYKNLKLNIFRLMAVLLCVMTFMICAPTVYATEETCGNALKWSFDGSTLTITGEGAMTNFSSDELPPWYDFREKILRISLPDGLTRIGDLAFYECTNLSAIALPSSVEVIGEAAFYRNSSMTMLTLNEGLRSIGRKAFTECEALADLRLPSTISIIENYAFSMCNGLTYVTIPAYVSDFGTGVFSYCENLIRVDIETAVELSDWSFYGCNQMQALIVQGVSVNPKDYMQSNYPGDVSTGNLPGNIPSDGSQGTTVKPAVPSGSSTPTTGFAVGESITADASGNPVVDQTTVTKTDTATTTVTNRTPIEEQGSNSANTISSGTTTTITATIQNNNGWNGVIDKVNSATIGGNNTTVNVTVYIPNSKVVSAEVLQKFAGKNVRLNIQTGSGSQYTLDCTKLEDSLKNNLELHYTLIPLEEVPEELSGYTVYQLKFTAEAKIPAELVIRLPGGHVLSTATLYQIKGNGKLQKLQSVVVDPYGDAHWYVSAVDEKTEYLIGIDVPQTEEESPIIPPTLHDVYKVENVYDGVEYVITGRSSSWGMNLGQVMGILAAVMVGVIALVGGILFMWNKSRLQHGYVPGLEGMDDEEDEGDED